MLKRGDDFCLINHYSLVKYAPYVEKVHLSSVSERAVCSSTRPYTVVNADGHIDLYINRRQTPPPPYRNAHETF